MLQHLKKTFYTLFILELSKPRLPLKSLHEFCYQGVADARVCFLCQENGLLQLLCSFWPVITPPSLFLQLQ